MFKNSNFFAVGLLSVSAALTTFAQETPKPPTAPQRTPRIIERDFQIFTGSGGSYLGVQSTDVTKENFSKYGLREVRGVAVEKVTENSPAAQAGFQNGDVIIRFNGEEVTSARKLTRLISEVAPDHQAEVAILRGGNEKKLNVTVGKRPAPSFEDGNFTFTAPETFRQLGEMPTVIPFPPGATVTTPNGGNQSFYMFRSDARRLGIGVMSLNEQLGEYFGAANGKGVLINNVAENSAAAKAGLKAGDVIVEVDGKAVASQADLTRTINEKKEGEVTLTIIRNKNRQTVRATPEKSTGESFTFQTAPTGQQRQFRRLLRPSVNGDSTPLRVL